MNEYPYVYVSDPHKIADLKDAHCFRRDGKIVIEIPETSIVALAENPEPDVGCPVEVTNRDQFISAVMENLKTRTEEYTSDWWSSPIVGALLRAIDGTRPPLSEGPTLWELNGPNG